MEREKTTILKAAQVRSTREALKQTLNYLAQDAMAQGLDLTAHLIDAAALSLGKFQSTHTKGTPGGFFLREVKSDSNNDLGSEFGPDRLAAANDWPGKQE